MSVRFQTIASLALVSLLTALTPRAAEAQTPASPPSAQDIANQANNPAAPLTLIQFRNVMLPDVEGVDGVANTLEIQPVIPIGPFASFPLIQLMKITFPLTVTVPGKGTGVGDFELFDLVTVPQSWGKWGFGPAFTFPTASDDPFGAGKWQAGPAGAIIFTGVKNLTVGAVFQNQISFAGSSDREDVNSLEITPAITMNLKDGWFAGVSDFDWIFDWKQGGAATFLIGGQVGKVVRLGHQPFSVSFEAGGAAAHPDGTPNPGWLLGFEIGPIFNFHIGPGEKIRLRTP